MKRVETVKTTRSSTRAVADAMIANKVLFNYLFN